MVVIDGKKVPRNFEMSSHEKILLRNGTPHCTGDGYVRGL